MKTTKLEQPGWQTVGVDKTIHKSAYRDYFLSIHKTIHFLTKFKASKKE